MIKAKNDARDKRYHIKNRSLNITVSVFRYFILIGLSFIILFPIFNLVTSAFKTSSEYFDATVIWFSKNPTLENIKNAISALDFPTSLWNTLKITVPCIIFQMLSCSMAGYGFSRFKFPGKRILFGVLIFLIIVPPQVVTIPTFIYYRNFDFLGITKLIAAISGYDFSVSILDSVWCTYLPAIFASGIRASLFIFIFNQFFKGLPKDLEEAAAIDGCNSFTTYLRIMLPNAVPVLTTVLIFSIVWYYNDTYISGVFMTNNKTLAMSLMGVTDTLTSMVISGELVMNDPYKANLALQAAAVMFLIPPLAIYLPLQKLFVENIDRTGIVG